jgi:hypothetical protein
MTDTVERMVWMDTIEPGIVLQWLYYDDDAARSHPEWVTVLAVRVGTGFTRAIVLRPNGEQDAIISESTRPIRIRAQFVPKDAS